jgi:hypothetical protein
MATSFRQSSSDALVGYARTLKTKLGCDYSVEEIVSMFPNIASRIQSTKLESISELQNILHFSTADEMATSFRQSSSDILQGYAMELKAKLGCDYSVQEIVSMFPNIASRIQRTKYCTVSDMSTIFGYDQSVLTELANDKLEVREMAHYLTNRLQLSDDVETIVSFIRKKLAASENACSVRDQIDSQSFISTLKQLNAKANALKEENSKLKTALAQCEDGPRIIAQCTPGKYIGVNKEGSWFKVYVEGKEYRSCSNRELRYTTAEEAARVYDTVSGQDAPKNFAPISLSPGVERYGNEFRAFVPWANKTIGKMIGMYHTNNEAAEAIEAFNEDKKRKDRKRKRT